MVSKKRIEQTLGYVTELYDDADTAWLNRRSQKTIEHLAFYRGRQYQLRGRIRDLDESAIEAAEVVNICRPLVNANVAAIVEQIPNPRIAPLKNDPRAKSRAKMAENLAFSFMHNGVIDMMELYEAVNWATIVGGAWIKDFWDPEAGRHLPDSWKTGLEGDGEAEDLEAMDNASVVREGEIATEFVSTIDGLPDPAAKSQKQVGYFIHRKVRTIRELRNRFPVDVYGEKTGNRWDIGTRSAEETAIRSVTEDDDSSLGALGTKSGANTLAQVNEIWLLPNRQYPYGLLFIWSGAMVLFAGPNPLVPVRLPFNLLVGPNKTANTLYGDGLLEDIKHLQRVVNKVETKKIEIIDKMANPHLMVANGSGIDKNTWGNVPGQVINYNKGYPPTVLQPAEVPQSMFQHTNDQVDRAKFLVSHSDLAQGNDASNASGRTVAFATQNSQKARAPQINMYRNTIIRVMQSCLYHARQRYQDGRIVRVVGGVDEMEAQEFFSEEYDFENEFLPEPFSDEPIGEQARLTTAMELNGAGFFADSPEAERMRRLVGGTYAKKSAFDPFQADRDRARRENLHAQKGDSEIPGVKTFDIHRIHLEEHNEFRKSVDYEMLPVQIQAAFDQHCDIHEQLDVISKLVQNQGGESENTLGAPPGPGAQPGPPPQNTPGQPSPPDGGAEPTVAPPPSIEQFTQMSPSEQKASDQE